MKKQITYLAGMLAISLACACTKATDVTPVAPTTNTTTTVTTPTSSDSFTVNGVAYTVDHKNVTLDSVSGKPLATYKIVLIHGTVSSAKPTGDYAITVDSVSTANASGAFNFHTAITPTTLIAPFGAVYYDNVSNSAKTTMYETLTNVTGSMTKTGARSFTLTATATNIFTTTTTTQNTAQISAVVTSF